MSTRRTAIPAHFDAVNAPRCDTSAGHARDGRIDSGGYPRYLVRTVMDSAHAGSPAPSARRRPSAATARDTLTGYLFIGPAAIVIGVFGIFPVLFILYVSVFKWRLTKGGFAGADNYTRLIGPNPLYLVLVVAAIAALAFAIWLLRRTGSRGRPLRLTAGLLLLAGSMVGLVFGLPYLATGGDKDVFDSLRVTVWYSVLTVPVQLVAGVALAVLLHRRMRGKQAFRVITLIPYVAPTVASAAIFELLFSLRPDSFGNRLLGLVGVAPLQWLQEPRGLISLILGSGPPSPTASVLALYWSDWAQGPSLALVSVVLYSWWVFIGYYALIYLNGLSAIPRHLYEAAEVDGAGRFRRFFSITLPLLSPTTYFLSMLGVIGTFKAFTQLYVLRSAPASGTTDSVSVAIFMTAFRGGNLGYASAISLLLFVIVIGLTVLQQRTAEGRVSYGD